jgi:phosphatidylserine decarboxylase
LVGVGSILALANLLLHKSRMRWIFWLISFAIWGFFARFFRDPPRYTLDLPNCVFAPADGTIVDISPCDEPEYFNDKRIKISIYMSALNVHLNRTPVAGTVIYRKYHPGQYLVAFHPKASELNERCTIVLADAQSREVMVRQIAGLLARRIVTYLQPGQVVRAGEELGFIKFGSRCDVFLPQDAQPLVQLDQPVRGGETVIARF